MATGLTDEHVLSAFSMFGFIFLTFLILVTVAVLYLERDAEQIYARARHDIRTAIDHASKTIHNFEDKLVDLSPVWAQNDVKSAEAYTQQQVSHLFF